MKHSILLVAAAFAANAMIGIGAASAADMPVKAAPIVAPVPTWTGCYVGGNAGWIGGDNSYSLAPSGSYLTAPGPNAPPNLQGTGDYAVDVAALSHSYGSHSSGGLVGAQVGCNQQTGLVVLGVEADWQWTSERNSVVAGYASFANLGAPSFTNAAHTETVSSSLNSFGTFRARGGYDFNHVFLYATGGIAVGDQRSNTNVSFATFPSSPVYNGAVHIGSDSQINVGWVIGAGAEYAFAPNWSVKAEYLYVDFGTRTYYSPLVATIAPAAVGNGYNWTTTVRERDNIVRVGLNYKFNWAAPVVAKY